MLKKSMKKLKHLSDTLSDLRHLNAEFNDMSRRVKHREYQFDEDSTPRRDVVIPAANPMKAKTSEDLNSSLEHDDFIAVETTRSSFQPKRKEDSKPVNFERNKFFVLDSNVLINDPRCIYGFDQHHVVIPIVVLEEIDRFKNEKTSRSASARAASRELDKIRQLGDLHTGVKLPNGGTLRVECDCPVPEFNHLPGKTYADNVILATVLKLSKDTPLRNYILVTEDINLRIRAASMGVEVEEYFNTKVDDTSFYDEVPILNVDDATVNGLFDAENAGTEGGGILVPYNTTLSNNVYGVARSSSGSALVRVLHDGGQTYLGSVIQHSVYGLKPLNKEQKFALDALLDPDIHLVVLTGQAGTGKSIVGLAAGLEQVVNGGAYSKVVLARPIVGMGEELGFVPGTLKEKMEPWMTPLMDSFEVLQGGAKNKKIDPRMRGKNGFDELELMGKVSVESLHHIRGRSMPGVYFQIDEAQNSTVQEIKTILTRAGKGTKVILCGDVSQIDSPYLTSDSCGLTHVIEKFKGSPLFAHIHFTKGERSALADLAANLL